MERYSYVERGGIPKKEVVIRSGNEFKKRQLGVAVVGSGEWARTEQD